VRAVRKVTVEEAKDLTQSFFLEMVEGGMLERYSPDLGSFRGYLRGAMALFLRDAHRRQTRLKQGGGRTIVSLDRIAAEGGDSPAQDPETAFEEEWTRTLLDRCLQDLKEDLGRTGKEYAYRLYERYEIDPPTEEAPTYEALAREFEMTEQDVASALRLVRRKLRAILVERIRDYVSDEEEAAEELDRILGPTRA
jgi:RNA polymerase sigma-70 factor (ECF subfamily)